jgi:phosphatidylserine/phosphatidylglycerophosphate/cardiolipin synthase-like enzyme
MTGLNVEADDYKSIPFSIKEVVARIEELPESCLRVFFCQNDFIHSKFIIVDDVFSTVDTTNLDFRSLETNFEVNVFIYNEGLQPNWKNNLKLTFKTAAK